MSIIDCLNSSYKVGFIWQAQISITASELGGSPGAKSSNPWNLVEQAGVNLLSIYTLGAIFCI